MQIDSVTALTPSFHSSPPWTPDFDLAHPVTPRDPKLIRWLQYRFHAHFHPYVTNLVHRLIAGSVRGLQAADTATPPLHEELFTEERYDPNSLLAVDDERHRYPVKNLDFSPSGAYAGYNWELFYHVPITIAIHLSRNQRFAEAQRWLHYVFDPTDDSTDPAPDRFWHVKPFRDADVTLIERVLVNLSTAEDPKLWEETVDSIGKWKDTPFRPHAVARYRHTAYMFKAVMTYLDNLIDWGDALFRQDTGESINEATQLYVLAANILGPRPQEVPRKGRPEPQTYASLRGNLDEFTNALTEIEVDLPFDTGTQVPDAADGAPLAALNSVATSLYFCVPRNDKLLGYWDTVADRLFKIRNSLDIHGVFRQLPMFEPPIDPALLAKAAAAGLDVGAIVAGLGQPLPLVRFAVLVARAAEICQEVKSLGGHLLSAIEKQDAEDLAILRARHERIVLARAESVRYGQWQEAVKAREGLEQSFDAAVARYAYYERLLDRPAEEIVVPALDELDIDALERMRFSAREPVLADREIEVDIADDLSDAKGKLISSYEASELAKLKQARTAQIAAHASEGIGALLALIPEFEVAIKPFGAGGAISMSGQHFSAAMSAIAAAANIAASQFSFQANEASKIGSYQRREQDWAFQSNVIASEITGIYKQWRAAQLREALAEREWRNHQQQIRNAEEIERYLTDPKTGKTSSTELYSWLRREVRGLYGQFFQFAYDVARKAERALQHELGDPHQTFLQYGYQAGKQGLLAGEKLYLDLKRMESAYHELNRREYELTKHASLRQVDPVALLRLRATGACEFTLPEELFDQDCPGHYFRRLRSVTLSIPCVAGPYAGVHATVRLQHSSIRTSAALRDGEYARDGDDTERFSDHSGTVQSIVTSSGNQDGGLFDPSLRDERYLPFEGAGAISRWRIELPAELPQFDHDTISDVVLHLRYTAREGGVPMRTAASAHLVQRAEQAATAGSVRLLSIRHEFPTAWARFTSSTMDPEASLTITLRPEHYPFWASRLTPIALHGLDMFCEPGPDTRQTITVATAPQGDPARTEHPLPTDSNLGGLRAGPLTGPLPPALGEVTLHLDDNSMKNIWLALTWGREP
jgi:hypothetical protein